MREQESKRQRCLLMKHIFLRQIQKQKLFITLCSALISLCRKQKVKRNRRMRRFDQNCGCFQKVWNTYDDERFKWCFRISTETFNFISNRIGQHLTHDTRAQEPISPQDRLWTCFYRLIRGDYYHTIAEMTGRGLTTVQCITEEVCKVIVGNNTRKSPEELRKVLKMVSSKSYLDTSKGAVILRNNICDYLWSKKELYNDL